MNGKNSGKNIIITGGASGIGKALGFLFAESGATVILFDINKKGADDAAHEIAEESGRKVYSSQVNVSDFHAFKEAVDSVIHDIGPVDIFINNAGIGVSGELVNNSLEEINHITDVNYLGMIYGSRIILPLFYNQGFGHLVNVASVAGLQGFPKMSLYCAAKAGIVAFTQAVCFEARRKGINVSLALPSTTDTPMIMDNIDEEDDTVPGILMAIPMCRTEDVAKAIFKGINKRKFSIFPTLSDRGALFARSYFPGIFNLFIKSVGFKSFKAKREKLKKEC